MLRWLTQRISHTWAAVLCAASLHALVFSLAIFWDPPDPPCRPCGISTPGAICFDPCDLCCQVHVAGRSFHHDTLFSLLATFDLPAFGLASEAMEYGFRRLLGRPPQPYGGDSYLLAALWLALGTVQWGLFGAVASRARKRGKQ